MIHIHARRPDGTPSFEVEDFRAITEAIRAEAGDVIINYSTGAIGVPLETRIAYLRELRPDVAALNMGSLNYAKYSARRKQFVFQTVFTNPFDEIIELLQAMNELQHQARARMLRRRARRLAGAAGRHGRAASAAARVVRHGRDRRDPAVGAQPRADGRQHPRRLALGRDRHLARAVAARRGGADPRGLGARRPGGQLLPARRHDGPLQRRPHRQGPPDDARRRPAAGRRSTRRARCWASRRGRPSDGGRAGGRARPRPLAAAARRLLLAAAGRPRRRRR